MSVDFSVLSQQVRWQASEILRAGIDQTRLVIADAPTEPVSFSFLVMGDTDLGSETVANDFSDHFSAQLLDQLGESRFLLHTGDVTYPVGSYENYLDGFLQSYRALLKGLPPISAYRAESIIFNRPLLPVPGNHDYSAAGFGIWQQLLQRVCDRLRQALGVDLGHYGGQGGEAYGKTFLDDLSTLNTEQLFAYLSKNYSAHGMAAALTSHLPYGLSYRPGQFTRLPNRYYTFRYGGIDFFALDSNTWNMAPDEGGFDHEQLAWLENSLVRSIEDSAAIGRIIYLHHSPYTTEVRRWRQPETLWVRKHLRAVLDKVRATVGEGPTGIPLVDVVLSGHAHCFEHLKTLETRHADAHIDWIVCGGGGADLRPQRRKDDNDLLENIQVGNRRETAKVAKSCFFAGRHRQSKKTELLYSFARVDVRPHAAQKIRVVPFIVENRFGEWMTRSLRPLDTGVHRQHKLEHLLLMP